MGGWAVISDYFLLSIFLKAAKLSSLINPFVLIIPCSVSIRELFVSLTLSLGLFYNVKGVHSEFLDYALCSISVTRTGFIIPRDMRLL